MTIDLPPQPRRRRQRRPAGAGLVAWRGRVVGMVLATAVALGGCANQAPADEGAGPDDPGVAADPLEPVNRVIFDFNRLLDTWFLQPAAIVYKDILPPPFQTGTHNFLSNLHAPVIFMNDVLQGKMARAGDTLGRFMINSTFGVAGLRDPATKAGLPAHDEDFGQTLAVWGVADGPFLMLPVFGPSNPRDAVGLAVDSLADPFSRWADAADAEAWSYARSGVTAVDKRARHYDIIEDLERTSLDFYATVRSLYRQRRLDQIRDGGGARTVPAPGLPQYEPWDMNDGAGGDNDNDEEQTATR